MNAPAITEIDSLEDRWLLGEIPLNDGTLLVRLNQAAEPYIAHPQLGIKLGFAIPFNAAPEHGLPKPTENESLAGFEDKIRDAVQTSTTGIHVLTLTAPEAKELVFYISEGAEIGSLHESLRNQCTTHEIQCMAVREPDWKSYCEFLPEPNNGG